MTTAKKAAAATTETESIIKIPLNKLVISPLNVRKSSAKNIEELAASIKAQNLIHNLAVIEQIDGKGKATGLYEVIAGGRRLQALQLLEKKKDIPADYGVDCKVTTVSNAVSASLAENIHREEMHPADECDAYKKMIEDEGKDIAAVAIAHGQTELYVKQRLKLANISPKLIALYRKGDLDLDSIMAYSLSDNIAEQEATYKKLESYKRNNSYWIKQLLTSTEVDSNNSLAKFIGVDAYRDAGGFVRQDMFSEEFWLSDSKLLNRLVLEKLSASASKIKKEGWAWVDIKPNFTWSEEQKFTTLTKPTAEQKKHAGCVVTINNGNLKVIKGLVKKEDKRAAAKAGPSPAAGGTSASQGKPDNKKAGHSAAMVQRLNAQKSAAMQACMITRPDVALVSITSHLAAEIFLTGHHRLPLSLSGRRPLLNVYDSTIEECKAAKAVAAAREEWKKKIPEKERRTAHGIFTWLLTQNQETVLKLLAVCVGHYVESSNYSPHIATCTPAMAEALQLDMRDWWQADRPSYLNIVQKGIAVAAVSEACGKAAAQEVEALKKAPAAALAENKLAGTGWLPKELRAPAPAKKAKAA